MTAAFAIRSSRSRVRFAPGRVEGTASVTTVGTARPALGGTHNDHRGTEADGAEIHRVESHLALECSRDAQEVRPPGSWVRPCARIKRHVVRQLIDGGAEDPASVRFRVAPAPQTARTSASRLTEYSSSQQTAASHAADACAAMSCAPLSRPAALWGSTRSRSGTSTWDSSQSIRAT